METHERLLIARKALGINQDDFARGLGLKRGSYSDVERGKVSNLSESTLLLLEINYGVNREWVLKGTGEMLASSGDKIIKEPKEIKALKQTISGQKKEIERLKNIILEISNLCKL